MRMSRMFGHTLRETPAEAETPSHYLLLRAGFIDQLMAGVYSYMPLGHRTKRKIEQIVREEMDAAGAQETLLPAVQPRELWEQTGRDRTMGDVLFPLIDRRERALVLGPTHEEVVTSLFRDHARSYRDLPVTLYQIQTKFRDEARPRAGLQRLREFTMKDAYSFDLDEDGLDVSYDAMFEAYTRIFVRCGVPVVPVEADSGAIGGKGSQEFVFLTDVGEDTIVVCDNCDYAANSEKAEFVRLPAESEEQLPIEEVATPEIITIEALAEFLDVPPVRTAKAVFYMARELGQSEGRGEPVFVVIRGDLQVNEVKVSNALGGRKLEPMTDAEVAAAGIVAGYASPIGVAGNVRVIADNSAADSLNLVAGANRVGFHLRNVNFGRDWQAEVVTDIALADAGHRCVRCADDGGGTLRTERAIEMGHIFRLGTTYSEPLEAVVLDSEGERRTPTMGCYGLGIDRIAAAAVEVGHDDDGIIWPAGIAPYDVHLVGLALDRNAEVAADADALYEQLTAAGLAVLFDDREESPGVKFNDADLIGVPIRVTVSARNHREGVIEMQRRGADEAEQVARDSAAERLSALHSEALQG
ncbi:MAG TPA: proline--tRNA ligase [Dehalococcoidia bacterium]|nr:proline--tRNA ligase [Dehalococcoidia bacterium]